jgi:N6-L-threonylcarbamoyladenine synthase
MTTRILGIESSCDETAAAVVADGRSVLSSVVASQIDIHGKYGGVVPELASREHLRRIVPTVREALASARITYRDLDVVAVTQGPGLVGALLVGLTYGKVLAAALGKPLIPVNHLEGHVHAVFLEARAAGKEPRLPAVCLIVSGGHTVVYGVTSDPVVPIRPAYDRPPADLLRYTRIGQTRDDAAGEAYDKVAKMLGLGYPGGPILDALAGHGDAQAVRFTPPVIRGNALDFSFSGIKTAVLRHIRAHPELEKGIAAREVAVRRGEKSAAQLHPLCSQATLDLIASFQHCVVEDLVGRTLQAAEHADARSVLVSGGVAANSALRQVMQTRAYDAGRDAFFPSRALSTDNAAMIAAAAYPLWASGVRAGNDLNAEAVLPLA